MGWKGGNDAGRGRLHLSHVEIMYGSASPEDKIPSLPSLTSPRAMHDPSSFYTFEQEWLVTISNSSK